MGLLWKTNVVVRLDDVQLARRVARRVAMAASALHISMQTRIEESFGEIKKRMVNHMRHTWNEKNECFKVVLKVCKNYEAHYLL